MAIEHELTQIKGIGDATLNKLIAGGITTIVQLAESLGPDIVAMDIAPATAGDIIEKAKDWKEPEEKLYLCEDCISGECVIMGCNHTKECIHDCIAFGMEIGKEGVQKISDRIDARISDPDNLAPSSTPTLIRMRSKRHRAPRHRKR